MILHLILIQVVTLIVIVIFLRLLFRRHLLSALRRLQELHQQNLEKEIALNKEIEYAKQQKQLEIEKGRDEAKRLRETAKQEVDALKEKLIIQAKQDTERMLKEAALECGRLKKDAVEKMEESSVRIACKIMKEIFSDKSKESLHKELVDELIEELRKIDKERLRGSQVKKAEVTSSYPLGSAQRDAVRSVLQEATGSPLELEERVDPAIISGLVINLGGLILDGSLSSKLQKIIPYLREDDKA